MIFPIKIALFSLRGHCYGSALLCTSRVPRVCQVVRSKMKKKIKQGRTDGAILYNVTREDFSHQMNLEERLKRSEEIGM